MPYISGKYYPLRRVCFFLGEGGLVFAAILLIQRVLLGQEAFAVEIDMALFRTVLVTVVFQLSLYFFDLYDLNIYCSFADTATRMTQAFGFGCIFLSGLYYVFPVVIIPSKIFLVGYLVICVFLAAWRFFYILALDRRLFAQRLIVLGAGKLAEGISHEVIEKLDSGYKIVAFVCDDKACFSTHKVPFYPGNESLRNICRKYDAERIIVALEDRRGSMPVHELIKCKMDGVEISSGIGFYEELTGKLLVEKVNPDWIIFSTGFTIGRLNNFFKRATDILFSLIGLGLSLPVMLISAIIIKLESPGAIFYKQERVGASGKNFEVIKFRSMAQDAEKNGAVWAKENDSRVTKFGGFIRKVRIDELPQLWNVLIGEMSLVGPRPERPVFVSQLEEKIPYYSLRHNIKPGVTGWAQICYPYGASEEDALRKLEYDLYYLKNISLTMDFWIIFQTIRTVLFQKGSR